MRRFLPLLKLIGVTLFIGILLKLDPVSIGKYFMQAQFYLLVWGMIFLFGILIVKSWRWHLLIQAAGGRRPWAVSFGEYMIGVFLSTFTPGKLGDFGKAAYLPRYGIGVKTGALIVIIERVADVGMLLFMALLSAGILYGAKGWASSAVATAGAACGILIAIRYSTRIASAFHYCKSHHTLPHLLLTTALGWFFHYLWVIVVARSIGIEVSIPVLLAAATASSLFNALPVAPLGLGTREAALLYFLFPHGTEPERIVALSMLMLLELLITALPGAWYWLKRDASSNKTSSGFPPVTGGTLLP